MKSLFSIFIMLVLCVGCAQGERAGLVAVATSSPIVGGETPNPTVSGWASTVKISKFSRDHCTGILIAPRLVMTAAHCLLNSVSNDFEITFPAALDETRLVIAQKAHPEFRRGTSREGDMGRNESKHDIALLLLDEPAPDSVAIAKLPTQSLPAEKDLILRVYGYGRTAMKNQDGGTLRTVEVLGKIEADRPEKISIDQRQGKGLCNGDSGGPVFIYENDKAVLVGVTSGADRWQTKNGTLVGDACRYFGVATQVGSYLSWISRTSIELK